MSDAPDAQAGHPSDGLRISDTERESAMSALGEHMSAGRLDLTEYGDRSAQVTVAKTRAELRALFTDLPDPQPRFGNPAVTAVPRADVPAERPAAEPPADRQKTLERVFGALVPLSALLAVVLFFAVNGAWQFFLIPAGMSILAGAVLGDDWRGRHGNWHGNRRGRRDYRYDRRDHRRDHRRDRDDD